MKKSFLTVCFLAITAFASAQSSTYVNGYSKSDGTYVQGYYKTTTDKTNTNNYSTQGNTNSYTGKSGTKPKDFSAESRTYSADKNVQTGPNGGQYYINSNGKKTYVPKK
jgi:type IV secretory pathway TrbL component